jgi:aspartate/methionine/tyrosine aminotransferase
MKQYLASRTDGVPRSGTISLFDRVRLMVEAGVDVINFLGGKRGSTPQHIVEAAKKALDEGFAAKITDMRGLIELREAAAESLLKEDNLDIDPKSEIVVTNGSKQAIFESVLATIDPGDEVLVIDPGWVTYQRCVRLAGGIPVSLPLREENDFQIDSLENIEKLVTKKTKMMIFCSPNNPTGTVFDEGEIGSIVDIAKKHDLLVLQDAATKSGYYGGHRHYGIASFPGMKERTITAYSFTYTYSMGGFRLGYVTANKDIIDRILVIHSHSVTCPAAVSQKAGIAALKGPQDFPKEVARRAEKQRDFFMREIRKIDGISCATPTSGFSAFPNVSNFHKFSLGLSEFLLEKVKVATVPGKLFGKYGEGKLRIVFTNPEEEVQEGLRRIKAGLQEFKIHRS